MKNSFGLGKYYGTWEYVSYTLIWIGICILPNFIYVSSLLYNKYVPNVHIVYYLSIWFDLTNLIQDVFETMAPQLKFEIKMDHMINLISF